MNKVHNLMVSSSPFYANWHKHPRNAFVHWVSFFSVAILVSGSLLVSIEQTASGEEGQSAGSPPIYFHNAKTANHPPLKNVNVQAAQDHILVKFKQGTTTSKKNEIFARLGLSEQSEISQIKVKIVNISPNDTPEEVIDRLRASERSAIEFAELDAKIEPDFIPNDPYFSSQWERAITNAPTAWNTTVGSTSTIVGIADTGVNCLHPDLAASCVPGWNLFDNNSNTSDVYGHGTKVAGTVAAIGNNGVGVTGQTFNAKIMPLRISGLDGYASFSTIAMGITWAADHGAKIVNNSYASGNSAAVQSAAQYLKSKGGLTTVSAGNSGVNTNGAANNSLIVVSGSTQGDVLYSWSSYGNDVDVSAPGCVTTTVGSDYGGACGTSFAAPMTAGTLALIFAANRNLTPDQAQSILFSSAKDLGAAGWDNYFGWGRIDAAAAVAKAGTSTPDALAPSTPSNLTAVAPDSTKVNLSWGASVDDVGVTGYEIYRNSLLLTTVLNAAYTDTAVTASTTYLYTVRAYDAAGHYSAFSNQAFVRVPVASVTITSFQVSAKGANSATVTWTTNIPSTGLVLYGPTSNLGLSSADATLRTSHTVTLTGLSPSTKYFYKISAFSGDSLSTAATNISSFRTTRK
jgi:thermitase